MLNSPQITKSLFTHLHRIISPSPRMPVAFIALARLAGNSATYRPGIVSDSPDNCSVRLLSSKVRSLSPFGKQCLYVSRNHVIRGPFPVPFRFPAHFPPHRHCTSGKASIHRSSFGTYSGTSPFFIGSAGIWHNFPGAPAKFFSSSSAAKILVLPAHHYISVVIHNLFPFQLLTSQQDFQPSQRQTSWLSYFPVIIFLSSYSGFPLITVNTTFESDFLQNRIHWNIIHNLSPAASPDPH